MNVPKPPQGGFHEPILSVRNVELVETAYQEQSRLVRSLGVLRSLLSSNNTIRNEAVESLQSAELAAQQVTEFIDQCIRAIPIILRPSDRTAIVTMKAFGLPEIAERILLELDPFDLLRSLQVNKTMHSTIVQSPMLQRKLFLQPDPDSFFVPIDPVLAQPFSTRVRFRRDVRTSEQLKPVCMFFIRLFKPVSLQHSHHGSRIQRMLVCQPPIFELEAYMGCNCSSAVTDAQQTPTVTVGREKLTSEAGFTLQELRDAAESLRHRHRLCPHAEADSYDDQGFVNCSIRFEARLELKETDPRIVDWEASRTKQSQLSAQDEQKAVWLQPYIAAKLAGACLSRSAV